MWIYMRLILLKAAHVAQQENNNNIDVVDKDSYMLCDISYVTIHNYFTHWLCNNCKQRSLWGR
jgi:hypothetical protein